MSSSSRPLFLATSWKDVLDGAHLRGDCSRASGGTRGSTSPSPRPSHTTLRTAGSSGWAPGCGPPLGLSGKPHMAQSNPYCLCSLNDHQAPPALLPAVNPCNPDILQREKLRQPPQRPHNDQRCHMGNAGLWGTVPQDPAQTPAWPSRSPHLIPFMHITHTNQAVLLPTQTHRPHSQSSHLDASPAGCSQFPRCTPNPSTMILTSRAHASPTPHRTNVGAHRALQKCVCGGPCRALKDTVASFGVAHRGEPGHLHRGRSPRGGEVLSEALQTRGAAPGTHPPQTPTAACGEILSHGHPAKPLPCLGHRLRDSVYGCFKPLILREICCAVRDN